MDIVAIILSAEHRRLLHHYDDKQTHKRGVVFQDFLILTCKISFATTSRERTLKSKERTLKFKIQISYIKILGYNKFREFYLFKNYIL